MRKQEFLNKLKHKLSGLPRREINERISFFSEMIDDRIEDGYTEEQAVAIIGNTDDISKQIIKESKVSKTKRKRTPGEIALLAIGSPLWIALGAVVIAVVIALYVSLWAAVVSIWSAFVAIAASAIGGIVASVPFAIAGNAATGICAFGAALVCGGVAIFAFYGCKALTKGAWWLTKRSLCVKKCFRKKEKLL